MYINLLAEIFCKVNSKQTISQILKKINIKFIYIKGISVFKSKRLYMFIFLIQI